MEDSQKSALKAFFSLNNMLKIKAKAVLDTKVIGDGNMHGPGNTHLSWVAYI